MNKEQLFTLENAFDKNKTGDLKQWTIDYLMTEGNNTKLAESLDKNIIISVVLVEFPLDKLKRIVGPEPEMLFLESSEKWEKRVESLVDALKNNAKFPPLIVTDIWDNFTIADGGHRYEALKRCGIEKYWTIFLFTKNESQKLLEERLVG
ncbi:MAG: ParB N-terminal domain-containing protein [Candidatus Shapirobacteria bacterium]